MTHHLAIGALVQLFRRCHSQYSIDLFQSLIDANVFHRGHAWAMDLLHSCFMQILQENLQDVRHQWNKDRIQPSSSSLLSCMIRGILALSLWHCNGPASLPVIRSGHTRVMLAFYVVVLLEIFLTISDTELQSTFHLPCIPERYNVELWLAVIAQVKSCASCAIVRLNPPWWDTGFL